MKYVKPLSPTSSSSSPLRAPSPEWGEGISKVGIAGSGIMGKLLALELVQAGLTVSLFDKSPQKNCSHAAGGLLTPLAELATNDPVICELGLAALFTHWPSILTTLNTPIYFKQEGSIVVAHPRDKNLLAHFVKRIEKKFSTVMPAEAGIQSLREVHSTTKQSSEDFKEFSGLPRPLGELAKTIDLDASLRWHDNKELLSLEPALSKFEEGYYLPQEGQIDNQQVLTVLEQTLKKKGASCYFEHNITHVTPHTIHLEQETHSFDWVFDCRGLGARDLFPSLYGLRGELIWLQAPSVKIHRPVRLCHPQYSVYVIPRPNDIYLMGASEIPSEDFSPISVQSTLELLTAVYSLAPGFAEARILKTVTECRPTLPHHLPEIYEQPGLTAINGLYRHGFLIAPTLAVEVAKGFTGKSERIYPQLWKNF